MASIIRPFLKQLITLINQQISKALCMSVNRFFTTNSGPLLKMISKRIESIDESGAVMKDVIEKSKIKMDGAIEAVFNSKEFKEAFAKQMTEQLQPFNPGIVCTPGEEIVRAKAVVVDIKNGDYQVRKGGSSKRKTLRNVSNKRKKQTKKKIVKKSK